MVPAMYMGGPNLRITAWLGFISCWLLQAFGKWTSRWLFGLCHLKPALMVDCVGNGEFHGLWRTFSAPVIPCIGVLYSRACAMHSSEGNHVKYSLLQILRDKTIMCDSVHSNLTETCHNKHSDRVYYLCFPGSTDEKSKFPWEISPIWKPRNFTYLKVGITAAVTCLPSKCFWIATKF